MLKGNQENDQADTLNLIQKEYHADQKIEDRVDNFMDNKNDLDLPMKESLANKFERLYKEEKSRRQFAEKELQEVKDDNKKLSLQISDMINKLKDAQF